jgi:hypothetical protein
LPVGELIFSLVLVVCFWPTLLPSNWRDPSDNAEQRWIQLIQVCLEAAGILGTLHAIGRLT